MSLQIEAETLRPMAEGSSHRRNRARGGKPTLLFVDDEPNVQRGMKRFMRTKRDMWNAVFAHGGDEALSIMAGADIDLVVTDMRMPCVDGAALLEWISTHRPNVIRIVLSGEASIEETYRIVGRSHRFLAKPCPPEDLVDTIEDVLAVRIYGDDWFGQGGFSVLDCLTTPPAIYTALSAALADPDTETHTVAEIVARDPGLAARILQLVNSAYFRRPLVTASIDRAVASLGLDCVRALFDRHRLGQAADGARGSRAPVDGHSLATAAQAWGTRLTDDKEVLDTIFAVGLFYRLGAEAADVVTGRPAATAPITARLLGLPPLLTDTLAALRHGPPAAADNADGLAERICDCALALHGRTGR